MEENSYSTSIVEVCLELSGGENAHEEDRGVDHGTPSEKKLDDDDFQYEDDDK